MTDAAFADDQTDEPDADDGSDILDTGHKIGWDRLLHFADLDGDISSELTETELTRLGADVVEDWERDRASLSEWREGVEAAMAVAAQDKPQAKTYPWPDASNVQYPMLTVAAGQFAARAYPAIIKGDEAVGVKVLGDKPVAPQVPQAQPGQQPDPAAMQQVQAYQQAMGERQAREARAKRVKTWLNYRLFYGMENWEGDVDALLNQLPITGMAFKKVYYDPARGTCSDYVNALRLTVPMETKSLERCPRVTQDFDLYPYEIRAKQRQGIYRDFDFITTDEDHEKARVVLEQHRLEDLDGDGVEEPYVITVDVELQKVLRIEAAFVRGDITATQRPAPQAANDEQDQRGRVLSIKRWMPFVEFPFLPDPKGRFYAIGFGQLLAPLTEVINTTINELLDAGHAANAGGGFIASGLRLQGAGQTNVLRWRPGEYKSVNASGQDVRNAIVERTLPLPSPTLFTLLDLVLGAAKDISSVKDVLTGDASNTAPVGTTLALIEQGLQSFTAIYKRVYRAQKAEFKLIYECEGRWATQATAQEYAEVLGDPAANFAEDFKPGGHDIVPVSDPTVVTKAQALAKAQVVQQTAQAFPGAMNPQKAVAFILKAADVDEADDLIAPNTGPPPQLIAATEAKTDLDKAKAEEARAGALKDVAEAGVTIGHHQAQGAMDAQASADAGGLAGMAGASGQPVGVPGAADGGGGPAGPLAGPELGAGPVGPDAGAGPGPADGPPGPENAG